MLREGDFFGKVTFRWTALPAWVLAPAPIGSILERALWVSLPPNKTGMAEVTLGFYDR